MLNVILENLPLGAARFTGYCGLMSAIAGLCILVVQFIAEAHTEYLHRNSFNRPPLFIMTNWGIAVHHAWVFCAIMSGIFTILTILISICGGF